MKRAAWMIVVLLAGVAHAQPGQAPVPAPAPPPAPYPPAAPYPPQPYAPQPYDYAQPQPQVPLTAEEHDLLATGEISDGRAAGGVLVNVFVGYGIGQAVQGRWSETGWIFTGGEILSIAAMVKGMVNTFDCGYDDGGSSGCNDADPFLIGGLIGYGVFRIWSIVDAATGPGAHNKKVRALRMRLGYPGPVYYGPYLAPPQQGQGGVVGLGLRF